MGSDQSSDSLWRRIHRYRLDGMEWLVLFGGAVLLLALNAYNLIQFLLHGRFFIFLLVRGHDHHWAYWSQEATDITIHVAMSMFFLVMGAVMLVAAIAMPILRLVWGKAPPPAYERLPPLSLGARRPPR